MIFRHGLLMNALDRTANILGTLLLMGWLSVFRIEGKRLKRMIAAVFISVCGVFLADAVIHRVPNAIAGFIYGAHPDAVPEKFLSHEAP
jgi:hypothetical protein